MNPSKISALETEVSELKKLVKNLLDKVNKLTAENTSLREELRHLKKLKGQPKIRPGKKDSESSNEKPTSDSGNTPTPKGKRQRSEKSGRTKKQASTSIRKEIRKVEGVQKDWEFKGYKNFTHIDVELQFTETCYQREYWLTPDGPVIAPLPEHVKGRFGDNLIAMVLDLYHSCSVTQPLLLDWLHSHDCSISEGTLNNLLTQNHEAFHQEREDILEMGIANSHALLVDDTGARHDGNNCYCTVIGNEAFTVFSSTPSKSRINFLSLLQGQRRSHVLSQEAIKYMEQVGMARKWIDTLSAYGEIHFLNEAAWSAFLDDHKLSAKHQRRWATEGVLKAGLLSNGFPESMIIHSDGARQFDTVFEHSLCWFHASRPLAKLIPANSRERAARDWIEKQYWNLYDDIEAYCEAPTGMRKVQLEQDFNHWVTTQVDYPELRAVLGQIYQAREELLLVLKYPWLPLHNNLNERQIREYVKRRKISGGTRSLLGQRCRDTFASLKKTCWLHGLSFSKYLKDRISRAGLIPKLPELVREKLTHLTAEFTYAF